MNRVDNVQAPRGSWTKMNPNISLVWGVLTVPCPWGPRGSRYACAYCSTLVHIKISVLLAAIIILVFVVFEMTVDEILVIER